MASTIQIKPMIVSESDLKILEELDIAHAFFKDRLNDSGKDKDANTGFVRYDEANLPKAEEKTAPLPETESSFKMKANPNEMHPYKQAWLDYKFPQAAQVKKKVLVEKLQKSRPVMIELRIPSYKELESDPVLRKAFLQFAPNFLQHFRAKFGFEKVNQWGLMNLLEGNQENILGQLESLNMLKGVAVFVEETLQYGQDLELLPFKAKLGAGRDDMENMFFTLDREEFLESEDYDDDEAQLSVGPREDNKNGRQIKLRIWTEGDCDESRWENGTWNFVMDPRGRIERVYLVPDLSDSEYATYEIYSADHEEYRPFQKMGKGSLEPEVAKGLWRVSIYEDGDEGVDGDFCSSAGLNRNEIYARLQSVIASYLEELENENGMQNIFLDHFRYNLKQWSETHPYALEDSSEIPILETGNYLYPIYTQKSYTEYLAELFQSNPNWYQAYFGEH